MTKIQDLQQAKNTTNKKTGKIMEWEDEQCQNSNNEKFCC